VAYTFAASDPRVRRHCESFARRGWRVYQLGLGNLGDTRVARLNGVVLVRWLRPRYRGKRLLAYAAAYAGFFLWARSILRRLSRRRPLRVVQANNIPCAVVWVTSRPRRLGTGVVLDIHDPEPELARSKFGDGLGARALARVLELEERLAAARADVVLCVHEEHAAATRRHGVRHPRLRCVVNCADERLFPLLPPRLSSPRLVYHGTVAARMGLDVVLRAVRELRDGGRDVTATILGDGDAVPALRALGDELGLAGAVQLTGERFLPEALGLLLGRAGLGIVPLRRDPITDLMLPTKLLEYVRLGIPAVVAWTPTISRYFPEGTVHFVREFSQRSVAEAIGSALADPEGSRERAARAQTLPIAQPWQAHEDSYIGHVLEAAAAGALRRPQARVS